MAPGPGLEVVLLTPDIPWNAGNLGRTCLAAGARLHLVRPLGFSLEERHVRRAGLDYWQHVDKIVWESWADFEAKLPGFGQSHFFSAEGERELWQLDLRGPSVLIFGRESFGLPEELRAKYRDRLVKIPMAEGPVRSLNVSTTAAIAIFEARRQRDQGPLAGTDQGPLADTLAGTASSVGS